MSDLAREVDRTCRRYRLRPSEFCGIRDPVLAFDFDMAMAMVHAREQDSRLEAQEHNPVSQALLALR
jgi:hypothetical protein